MPRTILIIPLLLVLLALLVGGGIWYDHYHVRTPRLDPPGAHEIRRELVTQLDFSEVLTTPFLAAQVKRLRSGKYVVAPLSRLHEIAVFDSSGRFERVVGVKGEGPGEQKFVAAVAEGPGDSLWVFDMGTGRCSVYTPGLEYARTLACPGRTNEVLSMRDGFILQGPVTTRELIGYHARKMDFEGRLEGWAPEDSIYDASDTRQTLRFIAAQGDAIWVAPMIGYELELWRGETLIRTLHRKPKWLKPLRTVGRIPRYVASREPYLKGMVVDSQGYLWTSHGMLVRSPTRVDPTNPYQSPQVFGGVIEVLDTGSGTVIASRYDPGIPLAFMPTPGLAYQQDVDEDGIMRFNIWRVWLAPRERGGS